jgi:hypothetical protein
MRNSVKLFITFLGLAGLMMPTNDAIAKTRIKTKAPVAEWTIMVYMDGDNNLEEFALANFRQMANVGSTDQVNIIVQLDRIPGHATTQPDWTTTKRFRVTYQMEPVQQPGVEDIGEANMGDPRTLRQFIDTTMKRYPAKHYMLDIWDHGQGYRFENFAVKFGAGQKMKLGYISLPKKSGVKDPGPRSTDQAPHRACSNDETDKDELFNSEIQQALTGLPKLDLIGFDCCLMSMVETTYAMRNFAETFVGSEELEPGNGWDYNDWLGQLVSHPLMTGRQLASTLVESYKKTYLNVDGSTTMTAISLTSMATTKDTITLFSNRLIADFVNEKDNIIAARNNCSTYAPGYVFYHIDMIRFCQQIDSLCTDPQLKALARNVVGCLTRALIDNYPGRERQDTYGSFGFAIYFPPGINAYSTDPYEQGGYRKGNKYFPVEFVEACTWSDFLHRYFAAVK